MTSSPHTDLASRQRPHPAALIASVALSVLPIALIWRLRWNHRLGLDYLHLLLIQLVLFIFASRLPSPRKPADASMPKPPSRTFARPHVQTVGPKKTLIDRASPQEELHNKTVRTLLEVVEPSLLPPNEPTSVQRAPGLRDWQPIFVDTTCPIHVTQHPNIRSLYAVRMVLDGIELERVVRTLREKKRWEWDRMCECGADLGGNISWVRIKGSWPIKSKNMVMYSTVVRLPPSASLRVLFASATTTHPLKQSDVSVKYAGYLVESVPENNSSCHITAIVHLADFGSLPTFIVKAILTKYIPSSLEIIQKLAQRLPPPTSDDTVTQLPTLSNPSESHNEPSDLPVLEKDEDPLRELVGQLKQLLSTLSAIHRPPKVSNRSIWTDRVWFWAGSAGLMVSSGIAFKIIKEARNQQKPR